MNQFGGQVIRRVAGIGVGVAMLVLGLAAPAYAAVPTITSFAPTHGPAGTDVTITGTFTTPVSSVKFNGAEAFDIPSANATTIHAIVPAAATTGTISVTDGGGSVTSSGSFTVDPLPAPTISASPTSGCAGTTVTITGTHLIGTSSVTFSSSKTATFTINSDTQVTTTVPAGAVTGVITVTTTAAATGGGTDTDAFTISSTCPTITSFTPTSGAVGTTVSITGTHFTGVTGVKFNGVSASFTFNSDTQITAKVPTGATTGKITVTTSSGIATSPTDFVVAGAPTITSFKPTSGPIGTVVTITGTNFTGATSVKFNTTAATSFTVNSATKITATVPTGATTGKISVTTPAGTATSTTNFTIATVHARSVTLRLSDGLNAAGNVKVGDGFALCRSGVPVKIQHKVNGHWKTIRAATTTITGKYAGHIGNKHGKYRTLAPKVTRNAGVDVCKKSISPVRTH